MKSYLSILVIMLVFSAYAYPQLNQPQVSAKSIPMQMEATIINGDTVPLCNLSTVNVISGRKFKSFEDQRKFFWLEYNVKVVYPFAILASSNFRQCEATIEAMPPGSKKRQYIKQVEKQLCDEYKKDLEALNQEQGRILIKLIDRETGVTPYEMIKDLKGSLTAFMWQTVGKLYGNNLKATYDPENEDKDLDDIIQLIEMGVI